MASNGQAISRILTDNSQNVTSDIESSEGPASSKEKREVIAVSDVDNSLTLSSKGKVNSRGTAKKARIADDLPMHLRASQAIRN